MKPQYATLTLGEETIAYEVIYLDRKTLEIAVHPDKSVTVKAPTGTSASELQKRVRRRAGWIRRQQTYFSQFEPRTTPRHYVNGETHLYLGRRYRLRVRKDKHDGVKLIGGYFEVSIKGCVSPERTKALMAQWYVDKATSRLRERYEHSWHVFKAKDQQKPRLQIRSMRKRWGSLSANGLLTLNPALIRTPMSCIDYVITHELCHLQHPNHSPDFYRLLDKAMPDWERHKAKLELTSS